MTIIEATQRAKNKHLNLAKMLKKHTSFDEIQSYIRSYKKYDNWTYRDMDIVHALLHN